MSVWMHVCQATDTALPAVETMDLSQAQIEVSIDGRGYRLLAEMWRNHIPRIEGSPLQRPMLVLIWVSAVDGNPIPDAILADSVWLVQGDDIWQGEFSDELRLQDPSRRHQHERIARDGPLWEPGSVVDVIVRVLDGDGRYYLLKINQQRIKVAF